VPFLTFPGTRAEMQSSPLANREHDYSVTTPIADDAICIDELSKAIDLKGKGPKSTFTVANPYMWPS